MITVTATTRIVAAVLEPGLSALRGVVAAKRLHLLWRETVPLNGLPALSLIPHEQGVRLVVECCLRGEVIPREHKADGGNISAARLRNRSRR